MRTRLLAVLLLALTLAPTQAAARQTGPELVTAAATLSVLAGPVQRVPSASGQPEPAQDGMDLAVGDRVLTGPGATALVTFLDGSTLTIQPESDVELRRAAFDEQRSDIGVQINLGTVWARVVRLLDPGSSFSLESNSASASVHDGLPGAQVAPDGSYVCWTRAGELTISPKNGSAATRLQPGQAVTLTDGLAGPPRAFAVNQSQLRVVTSEAVLPLLLMPDQARVAGFVPPGIEVNQVFGSLTRPIDGGFELEVPAGQSGPYTLILQGLQASDTSAQLLGTFEGREVYAQTLAFSIQPGQRLATQISQVFDPAQGADPRTAAVQAASLTALAAFEQPLPGKMRLAPTELQAAEAGR
jgi:hypothetical protein